MHKGKKACTQEKRKEKKKNVGYTRRRRLSWYRRDRKKEKRTNERTNQFVEKRGEKNRR